MKELTKTIVELPVSRFRRELNSLIKRIDNDKIEIIVTRNGQPKFVLTDYKSWKDTEALKIHLVGLNKTQ